MLDLAVIGAGPAGLSAAIEAQRLGLSVRVFEREAEPGGAVRHCGHLGFGMLDFRRLWTGPRYAEALRGKAHALDIRLDHAVTAIDAETISISTPNGPSTMQARRILLATGIRETPRAARLVSGARPFGLLTTGALQRFVTLHGRLPCQRPLIIGTDYVSLSTFLTLRHGQAKPVMLIGGEGPLAPLPVRMAAATVFATPVKPNWRLLRILGETQVEGAQIETDGEEKIVACDAVIFTGHWVPEAILARSSGLAMDHATKGPKRDAMFRSSNPKIFVAGNLCGPVRSSGICALDGRKAAHQIVQSLKDGP
jgi:thioredoxin reductase